MQRHSVAFGVLCVLMRGLHGLKIEARTRPVPEIFPPPPQRIANKLKKGCISRLHATVSKQIHKETDSSRLGRFTRQNKNTYQLWTFVNIRCSGRVHSAEFMNGWWINNLFEWEREGWMLRVHVNLRLRVSLFKQWSLVTSKTAILTPSLQINITWLRVSSLSKLFY